MSSTLHNLLGGGGEGPVWDLARAIISDISESDQADPIRECQLSLLKRLDEEPDAVLEIAANRIGAEKGQAAGAPLCWLRLYEDASLSKAAKILCEVATATNRSNDWIADVVKVLDMGIATSYATGRSETFEKVFQQLENLIKGDPGEIPNPFIITPPRPLETKRHIEYNCKALSFESFQWHLVRHRTPLIIPGLIDHWPASQRWQDPGYFLRMTLGGRRLVPVEIGESYTAKEYRSEVMPFREFLQTYVLAEHPKEVGYLAQHDLFTQIPSLREDIIVPDYCYTTPPVPITYSAAALTTGMDQAPQLSEPLLNAWVGPKGTKTPLHTDPYHNILCQVVGYKYVRLYAPSNRPYLYPGTVDEEGNDISNTSQVDISIAAPHATGGTGQPGGGPKFGPDGDLDARRIEMMKKFPMFVQAEYQEAILGPGECLYIPLGWWHYVESLNVSVSVSFWWN